MNSVFLCLGGNLGNRLENIELALNLIDSKIGQIIKVSGIYETSPWGSRSALPYLNMCIEIQTKLEVQKLMNGLLQIEQNLGRIRSNKKNSDRVIDVDILYFNNRVIHQKSVQVPHPRLHLRNFVLKPLCDIAPRFIHPLLKNTSSELLKNCKDKETAVRYIKLKPLFICFEGNIGAGKSTLAQLLVKKINATFLRENFKDNPYLKSFYKNPDKYALETEYWFLQQRFAAINDSLAKNEGVVVADFAFFKCLWFAQINLKGNDLKLFKKTFTELNKTITQPDLLVILQSDIKRLKSNISKRKRPFEKDVSTKYLEAIDKAYQNGLKKMKQQKIVHVTISNNTKKETETIIRDLVKEIKQLQVHRKLINS